MSRSRQPEVTHLARCMLGNSKNGIVDRGVDNRRGQDIRVKSRLFEHLDLVTLRAKLRQYKVIFGRTISCLTFTQRSRSQGRHIEFLGAVSLKF